MYKKKKILNTQKIYIRLATIRDAKFLLQLHNLNVKKCFFNSTNLIKYVDHLHWFKKKIKTNSKIYIGLVRHKFKFGYIRFDEIKNKIFEISLANLPIFCGKGFGSMMLKKSLKKFQKIYKPKKIVCMVKKNNTASIRFFLKNGFKKKRFYKKNYFLNSKFKIKEHHYFELQ